MLSIFGTEIFAQMNPIFAFFGLFKLTRIGRISEFIQKLNIPSDQKSYINIFKMSLFLTIWIHLQTCIWYQVVKHNGLIANYIPEGGEFIHLVDGETAFDRLIGYCAEKKQGYRFTVGWFFLLTDDLYDIEESKQPEELFGYYEGICQNETHGYHEIKYEPWYPPQSWIDYKAGYDQFIFEKDLDQQYLFFFYYAILFLSQNDIGPVNEIEIVACFFSLLISYFINTQLLSEISYQMGSIFHSAQEMQHKIDSANDVIENMKMDYENASSIRIYFLKT